MDYLGRSILELSSSGPGDLAAIVVLQQEVKTLEGQITTIQGQITFLQNESKTQQDEITGLDDQVAFVQNSITLIQEDIKTQGGEITALQTGTLALDGEIRTLQSQVVTLNSEILNLSNAIVALQRAPNIADCGTLVLTCPVTTDTATLRVPIGTDWDGFYSTGYSPSGSPFNLTPFVAVNFQKLVDFNPLGVYWARPAAAAQSTTASFEIDATASFIPSVDMAVRVGVKVLASLFSETPLFYFGYNEQRYRPSANVSSWGARIIINVPLKDASNVAANYIVFQVEALTLAPTPQQFVYGIGENFANQHHLIVKRIQ